MKLIEREYSSICRAIVCFGPASEMTGMKAGDYFQVTIDPDMCSVGRDFIRFGNYAGDEIMGWQRVEAMTVCEVLAETPEDAPKSQEGYVKEAGAKVTFWTVKAESG